MFAGPLEAPRLALPRLRHGVAGASHAAASLESGVGMVLVVVDVGAIAPDVIRWGHLPRCDLRRRSWGHRPGPKKERARVKTTQTRQNRRNR